MIMRWIKLNFPVMPDIILKQSSGSVVRKLVQVQLTLMGLMLSTIEA